jgi:peptidoglycan hydrolase-like protein with peptidoglycan-binding domain
MTDQPLLKSGSTGEAVRRVQTALGINATGTYDDGTAQAVRAFQEFCSLDVDGVVGDDTRDALYNYYAQRRLGLVADTNWGPKTEAAVAAFQAAHSIPVVDEVDDATFDALAAMILPPKAPAQSGDVGAITTGLHSDLKPGTPPAPRAPPAPPTPFVQLGRQVGRLIEGDIDQAAATMGCHPAWVHAVIDVEAGGRSGFLPAPDLRPIILFESHQFHVLTGGRFDSIQPNLSTSSWVRNYGPSGSHQWDRLLLAMRLDRDAAMKSASWGMFQVMGSNFAICGYENVQQMVDDMQKGEAQHLQAFVNFCRKTGAARRLAGDDPAGFARIYNGPGYAQNEYDVKLQASHDKWLAKLGS